MDTSNTATGTVVAILIAEAQNAPITEQQSVRAFAGRGLEGDRYFDNGGRPGSLDPEEEITLIEIEQIDQFNASHGTAYAPANFRRNIVTRDIDLNALVGAEFRVGDVTLRGIELCEPCAHLASITEQNVLKGMVHRAGLRAQIVSDGTITVGDTLT